MNNLLTWKEEFLTKTDLEKWIGLLPENLIKHNCRIVAGGYVLDDDDNMFDISGETCQLCDYYQNLKCKSCPLYAVRGMECYRDKNEDSNSPWQVWSKKHNPRLMIEWLTKIKAELPERTSDVSMIFTDNGLSL